MAEEPPSDWSLVYEGFDPAQEGTREALCALGNGYFTTRGAAPWARADGVHYPGTYLAGGYNRLTTDIAGRTVENESLVNFPNWLALGFRIGDGDWFDLRTVTILSYRQELDLRRAMLLRTVRFEDAQGRRSTLAERRLVSLSDMHLGAVELLLTAENWSGPVTVRSAIDGRVVNTGAKLYAEIQQQAPGTACRRSDRRRGGVSAGAHLAVEASRGAGGTDTGLRGWRTVRRARAGSSRNRDT